MWFSNLKAERLYRRGTVLLAAGLLVTGMAACGSGKESGTSNGKVNTKTEQSAQKSKNGTSSIPKNTSGVNPGQTSQPKTGVTPGQTGGSIQKSTSGVNPGQTSQPKTGVTPGQTGGSIQKNTSGVNPGQTSQPKTEGNNNQSMKQPKAGTVNVEPETKSSQKSGLKDDTIQKKSNITQ